MPHLKVVSTGALTDAQRAALAAAAPGAEIKDRQCRTMDEIAELVGTGCDVLLTFRIPNDIRDRAPSLRWVQLLSAGADHALGGPLKGATIQITTTSGIHATPIAEYTIASMLAYAHRLHVTIRAQIRREWARGPQVSSRECLRDKTLGIIGYGSIGRETARLAAAFGMTVLALKRTPSERVDTGWCPAGVGDPEGKIPARWFGPDEREAILAASDYVSVTLPLSDATRKFIGSRELAAMKQGTYIVNVGRGEVIDEHAMIEALRAGRIAGAGLDVFEHEPLESDSALWAMENVILTPHVSGGRNDYMDAACELFAENLRRFSSGRALLNLVDPALGY